MQDDLSDVGEDLNLNPDQPMTDRRLEEQVLREKKH